jgi:ketosteroid isomerase-like protein
MKIFLLFGILIYSSCKFDFRKNTERIKALNEMEQTDVDFSDYCQKNGMRKAFLHYMEDEGVLLRTNHLPIVGADAVEYISSINDSTIQLTWEPSGGDVSEKGDMGYTYGVYQMKNEESVSKGTYVTIWRKQKDGTWKFLLDTGNEGVGEEKEE